MGMSVGGKRGIVSDMNVVPLIDILLVLLVIFMMIRGTPWARMRWFHSLPGEGSGPSARWAGRDSGLGGWDAAHQSGAGYF